MGTHSNGAMHVHACGCGRVHSSCLCIGTNICFAHFVFLSYFKSAFCDVFKLMQNKHTYMVYEFARVCVVSCGCICARESVFVGGCVYLCLFEVVWEEWVKANTKAKQLKSPHIQLVHAHGRFLSFAVSCGAVWLGHVLLVSRTETPHWHLEDFDSELGVCRCLHKQAHANKHLHARTHSL